MTLLLDFNKYLGICKVYVLTSFVNTQTKLGAYETFMASLTTYVRSTIYPSRHATSFQRLYDVYTTSATSYRRRIDVETMSCVYREVKMLLRLFSLSYGK